MRKSLTETVSTVARENEYHIMLGSAVVSVALLSWLLIGHLSGII